MDHPCHKCGHSIEDGKAFCSECGAPQIRVAMPEVPEQLTPASDGAMPVLGRDVAPVFPGTPAGALPVRLSPTMQSCALAAAVAVGLTLLGLNAFVAALSTGFLAVVFFRRRGPGTALRAAAGARLGALSGLMFFGAATILQTLAVAVLHKGAEIRGEMIDKFQQAAARYPGPELQPLLDFVKSPNGFAFMMVVSLIVGCVALIVLGSLGGALGAALLGRSNRP